MKRNSLRPFVHSKLFSSEGGVKEIGLILFGVCVWGGGGGYLYALTYALGPISYYYESEDKI